MNSHVRPQLRVVILAAGFSRRLGEPKALVRIRGVGLLRRTAMLLEGWGDAPLIVVAPPRSARFAVELRGLGAELCVNARRSLGLSSSVRLGVARARAAAAVLIVPADLAALQSRDVARLISAWRGGRRRLVARRTGAGGGAPLILPRGLFGAAARIGGDAGLRDLPDRLPAERRRLIDLRSAAFDVDDAQDLAAARRSFGRVQARRK
jgi:molybdenum cofactor cytidylyltransferase